MPNLKSAKKRAIQGEKRRATNTARKSAVRSAVKKVMQALEAGSSAEETKALLREAEAQLARAKGKGVVTENAASRKLAVWQRRLRKHTALNPR